eukprot:scaffold67379_cov58-Phaeocystis_antarctica.AAC.2
MSARSCCLLPPVLESLQLSAAARDGEVETPMRSGSRGVSARASAAVMSIADGHARLSDRGTAELPERGTAATDWRCGRLSLVRGSRG